MRIYAIGDVHGQLARLQEAHRWIEADGGTDATVVHLGDLIDRGPDSAGVVRWLMDGQARGRNWLSVKGNHDRQLPSFLRDPRWLDPGAADQRPWPERDRGASATLMSYGVDPDGTLDQVHRRALAAIPPDHVRWLDGLPLWHLTPKALFVHAGIRPGVDLRAQDDNDLLWIRRAFHDDPRDHGILVVHGHTPIRRATHYGNRVNLDTGAGQGGPLTAAVFDGGKVWLLGPDGRRAIDGPRPE